MIIVSRGCNIIFRLFSPLYAASPLLGLGKVILIENRNIVDETEDSIISSQYIRKKREILPKRFEQRLNNFSKNDGISSFIRRQRIQTDPLKGFNYLINSNRTLSKVFDRFWPNDLPLYPKLKYISSPTTNLHPFESGTDPKSWSRLFPAIWPTVNFVQVACGIARDENGCLVERISIHSQRSKNPSAGERGRTEPWGGWILTGNQLIFRTNRALSHVQSARHGYRIAAIPANIIIRLARNLTGIYHGFLTDSVDVNPLKDNWRYATIIHYHPPSRLGYPVPS